MSVTALAALGREEVEAISPHADRGDAVEGTLLERDLAMSVLGTPWPLSGFRRPLGRRRSSAPTTLLGRREECAVLDGLLEAVRAGQSGALVLRGGPGIGKTALLEYAVRSASDLTVVRAAGMETETQ